MIVTVIPTKIQTHLFDKLLDTLDRSKTDYIVILNNGDRKINYTKLEYGFRVRDCRGKSVYQMWNEGLDLGDDNNAETLILNDDVEFAPHLISVLSMYLERDSQIGIVFPDYNAIEDTGAYSLQYTDTTAGAGGMSGYCFMVRRNLGIRVDENLKLYWGDDDLVKQVISRGYKIARVVGLPILHAGSYTISRMDAHERRNLMEADRQYFNQKYGEHREPV